MKKVAINGFGRIGRMVFRQLFHEAEFEIVAINASYTPQQLGHLIQYDSIHGMWDCDIQYGENSIIINGKEVKIVHERNPEQLPWEKIGVEYVIESTGAFCTLESNVKHLKAGAKKVILTAPPKDDMPMFVVGVNDHTYNGETIISNASCTTNCLSPVIDILHRKIGIVNGLMTTIHSVTNDQTILDNPHKDLRRARAAGLNMVPTSTGAAKAIGKIIPDLKGKLNGMSVRVPTPNVSLVDVVLDMKKPVTKEEINAILKESSSKMLGILDYNELPLVSSDYISNTHSCIVDGLSTMVIDDKKVKLLLWYDNEYGYSKRVIDLLKIIST